MRKLTTSRAETWTHFVCVPGRQRTPSNPGRSARKPAIWAGALEALASVLLILALRRGPLAVAGVLASLYPVSTVLLAAMLLRERLLRVQWVGVGLALIAVALTGVP